MFFSVMLCGLKVDVISEKDVGCKLEFNDFGRINVNVRITERNDIIRLR